MVGRARSRSRAPPRGAGRRGRRRTAALIRSPASTVRSARAFSWAWIGTAPYASRNAPLPKVWSKCSWVLTTAVTSPAPSRRTSSTTLAGRARRAVGVDHQQARASPPTRRDVDVVPLVPGDPDPVGDLREARLPWTAPSPSRLGTPRHGRVPALGTGECQATVRGGDARTAGSPCSAPSWRTTSPPRSRSAPRRWSSGTASASPRPRCATTWPRWRRRASSPSRTPAPAGCPTDKGYRLFVDRLTTVKPMSAAEKRGDRHVPRRRGRPRRRRPAVGAAARPADPPGRGRAVPHALPLHGPPRRAGRAHRRPGCWSCSSSAPAGSSSGWSSCPSRSPTTTLADLRRPVNRARSTGAVIADARTALRAPAAPAGRRRRHRRASSTPSSRRCPTTAPTSGSRSAAPPTWRGSATASTSSVRPLLEALEEHVVLLKLLGEAQHRRHGHRADRPRGPLPGALAAPASSPPATARATRRWRPGHRGPDPHGLPRHDGGGARGRPLRLPDPRRGADAVTARTTRTIPKERLEPGPLRAPRCRPRRGRRRHQEGLPPAGPAAAPRRQPRPGDAGDSSRRSPAPTRCCRDPQKRAAYDRGGDPFGGAAPAASARAPASRSPTSWTPSSAAAPGAAQGRGPAAARAPRPGRPDPARGRPRRGGVRRHPRAQGRHRGALHDLPRRGRGAGHPPGAVRDLPRRRRGGPRAALVPRRDPHPAARARPAAASARSSPTRAASAPATAGSARVAR